MKSGTAALLAQARRRREAVKLGPRLRTEHFRWRENPETHFTVRD